MAGGFFAGASRLVRSRSAAGLWSASRVRLAAWSSRAEATSLASTPRPLGRAGARRAPCDAADAVARCRSDAGRRSIRDQSLGALRRRGLGRRFGRPPSDSQLGDDAARAARSNRNPRGRECSDRAGDHHRAVPLRVVRRRSPCSAPSTIVTAPRPMTSSVWSGNTIAAVSSSRPSPSSDGDWATTASRRPSRVRCSKCWSMTTFVHQAEAGRHLGHAVLRRRPRCAERHHVRRPRRWRRRTCRRRPRRVRGPR